MKRNDIRELHTKTIDELTRQVHEIRSELAKQEIDATLGKVKNVAFFKEAKRDIARIMTIMRTRDFMPQKQETSSEKTKVTRKKAVKEGKNNGKE